MKKILIIIFIYLFQINFATANTIINFIDMNKIISTSKPGLSIIKQLNKVNSKNIDKFKNDASDLKIKENKLISLKNVLSTEDYQLRVNKLKSEINNYNDFRNNVNIDFKKLKIDNTNKFIKMINPILVKYSKEKSISIILQKKNLVIGKTELDITDEIIKIINNDISEFKIK